MLNIIQPNVNNLKMEILHTNARQLRKNMTDSERRLWRELRLRQIEGVKFRRQFQIGQYIVDFCCPERKLIVEVDGGQHAEQADYDASRTRWFEGEGFRVLRFWNNEVLMNIDGVKESVYQALTATSQPPTPALPHKEGGGFTERPSSLVGEGVDRGE